MKILSVFFVQDDIHLSLTSTQIIDIYDISKHFERL